MLRLNNNRVAAIVNIIKKCAITTTEVLLTGFTDRVHIASVRLSASIRIVARVCTISKTVIVRPSPVGRSHHGQA